MSRSIYRFADFVLDPAARELHRGDERLSLPPKSLECLIYLIEHRDRAVGRDELISAVWGRLDVSDALLAQTLLRARRAVGDSGNDQSSIRTVPRFGYQWIAPTVAAAAVCPSSAADTDSPTEPRTTAVPACAAPPARRVRTLALVFGAVALVAGLIWLIGSWSGFPETIGSPSRDLIVVAPVSLQAAGADVAWVRLGVMDYISARLRDTGLTVLPSERVATLVAGHGRDAPAEVRQQLRRASGAARVLQPEASRDGDGNWQMRLTLDAGGATREFGGSGATPLAAADLAIRRLLAGLGRDDVASPPAPEAERLLRFDAAMLEGDLTTARALIAEAAPSLGADPALQVREGQLAFRAGDLDDADRIFSALLARLDRLPQRVRAQTLMGLGALGVRRNAFAKAEHHYTEALAELGPEGPPALVGNGYSGRGAARAGLRQHEQAADDLARARDAYERAGDAPGMANVDTNLGLLESRSGKPLSAMRSFDRAIAVFERYGIGDTLAASLLGKARVQVMLGDIGPALATAERAWTLAQSLENPVLVGCIGLQLADALRRNGRLSEAVRLLDTLPGIPDSAYIAQITAQLALDRGDPARVLALLADDPLRNGSNLLLAVRATLDVAAGTAPRERIVAALGESNPHESDDDAVDRELAHALWDQAVDPIGARAHFVAALARADADGNVSARVGVLTDWLAAVLHRGELELAAPLAGQITSYVEHDYRAAIAAAEYYAAIGDDARHAYAEARVAALAGERQRPVRPDRREDARVR